jgi:hypothetical protein
VFRGSCAAGFHFAVNVGVGSLEIALGDLLLVNYGGSNNTPIEKIPIRSYSFSKLEAGKLGSSQVLCFLASRPSGFPANSFIGSSYSNNE